MSSVTAEELSVTQIAFSFKLRFLRKTKVPESEQPKEMLLCCYS